MARNPDNDIANEFIDTMHTVLLDAIRNFVHMHWDENDDIWYEGCDIGEAFELIDMHFTPIKELASFYNTLCTIPKERINFMFSGDIEDLDVEYYKRQFDKRYEKAEQHLDAIEKISVMAQDGEDLSDAIRDILKGDR